MVDSVSRPGMAEDPALVRRREELILQAVAEGIYGIDPNGFTTFVNSAAESLLGWESGELLGRHQHKMIHHTLVDGSEYDEKDCPIHATLIDGVTREVPEDIFWRRDGTSLPVAYTCTAISEGSEVVGAVVTFRDITEQKKAEELNRDRRRQTGLAADVGIAVTDRGDLRQMLQRCAEAVVRHLDAAFARIWTLDDESNVLELQASAGLYTHLDGPHGRVPVGMFKIGKIAEEAEPHLTNDVQNDPRVSDKEWARREGMVSFAGYPLLVERKVLGVVAMFGRQPLSQETLSALETAAVRIALVIQRRRSDAELLAREEQLAEAQRIAHIGSWQWRVGEDRVTWSDELFRIYGLEPGEEMSYERYIGLIHPDDRPEVLRVVQEALATGSSYAVEHRIVRPDGQVRITQSRGRTVVDAEGKPLRLFGTAQDITEAKEAERNSLQLAAEQALRSRAEEEERRAALLAEAAAILTSTLNYEKTLQNLARLAVERIADWCAIDIVMPDRKLDRLVISHPDPVKEELAWELHRRYPPDPSSAAGPEQVVRTGTPELLPELPPEFLEQVARDAEHLRILQSLNIRSLMIVPLIATSEVVGVITFAREGDQQGYDERDLGVASEIATRAAFALENALLFRRAQEAQAEVTRILESITDAFFAVDRNWNFTYINDAAENVLKRDRDEILGRGLWDEFPEAIGTTFETMYRRAVDTGETVQFEEYFAPLDSWFEVRAFPGEQGLSIYFRNINEERQAREERDRLIRALAVERSRLREIFQEAPAFIATLRGPDHVFEIANPAYLQLIGHRDVIGRTVAEALPEVVEQGFVDLLNRVYRSGEPFIGTELPVKLQREPEGPPEEVYVNFVYQPMVDSLDQVSGIFVHGVDVTPQVNARQEVEQKAEELSRLAAALAVTNRELDQFAYVASHDLKAPLRGIANLSQWIEEDLTEAISPEVREHLDLLRGRVHRMEGLIDGILQYSRAGRVRDKPDQVDVGELLREVVDLLAPPEDVQVVIGEGMPTFQAERLPLQQVFMNLIGNAIKYARVEGPRIEVTARDAGGEYEFTVADNGVGIADEYHERIFGIFQTLEARDKVEGTGIGLSLVKKIVENRGGRVWVESEVGAGAAFRFLWPKHTPAALP